MTRTMKKRSFSWNILLKILLGVLCFLVLSVAVLVVTFLLSDKTSDSLQSSGENRKYLLYVPETYNPATATPLVISIHGFAEWPAHQMQISRWNKLADEYGFIVVYPSGTGFPKRWRAHGPVAEADDPMLDVTFISELIDTLEQQYNIDKTRIYANGLSNGGGMSFLLACKLSDRIAAIGGVSGAYLLPWEECQPARPVPLVAFHGTSDPIVPYEGGPSASFDIPFPALPEWIERYAERNGCASDPEQIAWHGAVSGIQYSRCDQNAEVLFFTIQGGGHSWPGGEPLPEFIVGQTTQDIDATAVMWQFFQQHPLVAIP